MPVPKDPPEPRRDPAATTDESTSAVYTTAARALVLGLSLTGSDLLEDMDTELRELDIDNLPGYWGGWKERIAAIEESDNVLNRYDTLGIVREAEFQPFGGREFVGPASTHPQAADMWTEIADGGLPSVAIAWLRLLMADRHPLTSAAAATALAHWRRAGDVEVPAPLVAAKSNLESMLDSPHEIVREIVAAATSNDQLQGNTETNETTADSGEASVSLIVHGTWSWFQRWWDQGGDFHSYIARDVRPNLYSGPSPFCWNGAYRKSRRELAAERLARWGQLDAVFAHSYGGIIALRATHHGLKINDLILLSVPGELVGTEWGNIRRAKSLRIHADLVLLAARRRQRFQDNVAEHHLPYWFTSHSFSHDPEIWRNGEWSKVLGLTV